MHTSFVVMRNLFIVKTCIGSFPISRPHVPGAGTLQSEQIRSGSDGGHHEKSKSLAIFNKTWQAPIVNPN